MHALIFLPFLISVASISLAACLRNPSHIYLLSSLINKVFGKIIKKLKKPLCKMLHEKEN